MNPDDTDAPSTDGGTGYVAAIDPGRAKCGVACLAPDGTVIARDILAPDAVASWVRHMVAGHQAIIVLGDGTGHRSIAAKLDEVGLTYRIVNERNSSALARRRYLQAHPPRGWQRFVPIGLRAPDRPYDDWVAVVLAERVLERNLA